MLKSNFKTILATITLLAFAFPSHADEEKKSNLKPAASIQLGKKSYTLQAGMGSWEKDKTHIQVYISHFKTEDTIKVNGHSLLESQEYTSNRLGIQLNGFGNKAIKGDFFLYKNNSELNIDRFGIGLSLAAGKMLTNKFRVHGGVELMPEFLSSDWDAKALLEYTLEAGLTYRITSSIDASINYRYGATLDDTDINYYSQASAGIALKL